MGSGCSHFGQRETETERDDGGADAGRDREVHPQNRESHSTMRSKAAWVFGPERGVANAGACLVCGLKGANTKKQRAGIRQREHDTRTKRGETRDSRTASHGPCLVQWKKWTASGKRTTTETGICGPPEKQHPIQRRAVPIMQMTKSRESTDDKQETTHNYDAPPHPHTDPFQ